MTLKIRRAAVLGAGVMGAQIAAQLAAAGVSTDLLDLASDEPPKDPKKAALLGGDHRSALARLAIENLKTLTPPPLHVPSVLAGILPGNFDDHWDRLAEADWIIEAVVERLDVKRQIHARISRTARPGVPVTTNTSGLPLARIALDLPEAYRRSFFGVHFFNPPRYMKLVEVVGHADSDETLVTDLSAWIRDRLGKGIVRARDTINFIANRVGVLTIQVTLRHMSELGLDIETVDALTGKLMGRPSSATFRTMDVVGLDTYAHVARNVYESVPEDPYRDDFRIPDWLQTLIGRGHLGQKSGGSGCYQKGKDPKGGRMILAYRPAKDAYAPQEPAHFPWEADAGRKPALLERLGVVLSHDDDGARLVWRVLRDTFAYSALLLDEIAGGDPRAIDDAIRWGFNWEMGPFELWQGLGVDPILERLRRDQVPLPEWVLPGIAFYEPAPGTSGWALTGALQVHRPSSGETRPIVAPPGTVVLPRQLSPDPRVVLSSKGASLVDLGGKIACLVFHSKMNSIDEDVLTMCQRSLDRVAREFDGLVIGNQGEHFCAGANLKFLLEMIQAGDQDGVDRTIRQFQDTMMGFKYAPFPVIACPHGMVLGGGAEVALHADERIAAAETWAGLVEIGVGLLPAGGGTKELALRAYGFMKLAEEGDPMPFLRRAFMLIGKARTSTSGQEAVEMGLFPGGSTRVTLSRDTQFHQACQLARLRADEGYAPPLAPKGIPVPGDPGIQTFKMMLYNMVEGRLVSEYDAFIGERIATILCGGSVDPGTEVDERWFLDLERHTFLELCRQEKTAQRMAHMLETGKPLRN